MSILKSLANDLLNLEINAILVDGISSRKMPSPEAVLQEIAEKYALFLQQTAVRTERVLREAGQADLAKAIDVSVIEVSDRKPTVDTFTTLRDRALALVEIRNQARETGLSFDPEVANVLRRAYKNCKPLQDLVQRDPSLQQLTPHDLLSVRKIWEVGTERVLMQTVVQIDGDIVTRIQTGRETEKDRVLHDMQKALVSLAIRNWQFMVRTLADLAKTVLRLK